MLLIDGQAEVAPISSNLLRAFGLAYAVTLLLCLTQIAPRFDFFATGYNIGVLSYRIWVHTDGFTHGISYQITQEALPVQFQSQKRVI